MPTLPKRCTNVYMEPTKKRMKSKTTALTVIRVELEIDDGVIGCEGLLIRRPGETTMNIRFGAFQDSVASKSIQGLRQVPSHWLFGTS